MKQRCPDSAYAGLALLQDWKWIINSTGYANIVPSPGDVVYGGLFFLSGRDEAALDHSEGVPWLYEKHNIPVARIRAEVGEGKVAAQKSLEAMTYVDVQRVEVGTIEPDYVVWIHRGIRDALGDGLPLGYAEKYVWPFAGLPPEEPVEITMVRTGMRPGAGSLLDHEMPGKGVSLAPGYFVGGGMGRVRDGSTA